MREILVTILTAIILIVVGLLLWLQERTHIDKIKGKLDIYYNLLREKRKTIRLRKRINAVCSVIESPDSHWNVFSKDVSGEGVCLCMPEILPEDALVDIKLDLPNKQKVALRGKVVWVKDLNATDSEGRRQFRAGVKFIKINSRDRELFAKFIAESLESKKKGA